MKCALLALTLAGAAAGAAAAAAAPPEPLALSMQVDPQKESCLYEEVSAGWEIDATALVYRGGQRACAARRARAGWRARGATRRRLRNARLSPLPLARAPSPQWI